MTAWLLIGGGILLLFGGVVFFGAPYVPSLRRDVERLFGPDGLAVGPDDVVLDVGSGDGNVLRAAAMREARTIGYELNPVLVILSRVRLRGTAARIRWVNAWRARPEARVTVIYSFGASPYLGRLVKLAYRQARAQRESLRLVSYGHQLKGLSLEQQCGSYFIYRVSPPFTDEQA